MKIIKNNIELKNEYFIFPGGEINVKIDSSNLKYLYEKAEYQTIIAKIQSSLEVMQLVMLVDALRRFDSTPIRLFLPYVPYGRQDRVCNNGEAFSLKAFAGVINSLNFSKVIVCDPHSEVIGAVFDNVTVISQKQIINKFQAFIEKVIVSSSVFISPDAGSNKKTSEIAKYFNHNSFVRADKLRDLSTGEIKETIVYATETIKGADVFIVDDICDGGRTFIELAKVLKRKDVNTVNLYVTHGIFSKGTKVLFENGIDAIYTTNSFFEIVPSNVDSQKVNILNIDNIF